tara:strand:- start:8772 stop:12236 length:3465 start_codon:yes stop_codon:yes gene_type:complete
MKISLLFLLTTMFQLQAGTGYAQKISLNMKQVSVKEVMEKIETISEYKFFYSKSELDLDDKININLKSEHIENVLSKIFFKTKVAYKIMDTQIVLTPKKEKKPVQKINTQAASLQYAISGTVTDADGTPLPGASVLEKGTVNGVQTDFDGNFSMTVTDENAVLEVSYIGFTTKEVAISGQTNINVILQEDTAKLDEVVVVGFGSQKARNVVSSVVQVTNEDLKLEQRPVTNALSSLIGSAPGLVLTNNNGSPGSVPAISIRGTSTIGDADDVLVIIDNFEGDLSDIDPQTIESVSILKDASAVAVYGARGANGVLLVTTKKGSRNTKTTISYNTSTSIQSTPRLQQTLNSSEYFNFQNSVIANENLIRENDGDPATEAFDLPWGQTTLDLAASGFYPNTNWIEEAFQNSASQQSHNLTLSGGSENTSYLMSAGYLSQEGLSVGEDKFERLNLRLKIDTDINDWLNVGANALISNRTDKSVTVIGGSNNRGLPFFPVTTVDGLFVSNGTADGANTVASSSSGSFEEFDLDRINLQLYAKITPFKGLSIEERVSVIKTNQYGRVWTNPFESVTLDVLDPDSYTNPDSENRIINAATERILSVASIKSNEFRSLTSLTYEFQKKKHNAKIFLAIQTESGESEAFAASRTGFILDNVIALGVGTEANDANNVTVNNVQYGLDGTGNSEIRGGNATTLSYIGRLNYSFDDKYLLEAAFRRDGSSFFTENNKYGFFPSIALGWVVSRENFLKNVDFISLLKFRSSYGQAGSDGTLGSVTQQLVGYDPSGYPFGGLTLGALGVDSFVNPDLIWETSTIFNAGLDASLFKGKLQFDVEYFVNNRTDILDQIAATAFEFGFGDADGNPYDVRSSGWDFSISHKNKIGKNFSYNLGGNLSYYDNEITRIQGGATGPNFEEGQSVNDRFGFVTDDFFDNQAEIDAYVTADGTPIDQSDVGGSYIGGFKYLDQLTIDSDGDGVFDTADGIINNDDRVIIDENSDRNLNVGFNIGLSYKNLSLSARFYGALDNTQFWNSSNVADPFLGGGVPFAYQTEVWSPTNTNSFLPRPTDLSNENYNVNVDHFLVDAEFIKLQNVTLNYDFGNEILDRIGFIKNMSFYLSMENVGVVWTNSPIYEFGWDPELGVNTIDYPLPFTTAMGLNIKF